jgi:hypothetical protein
MIGSLISALVTLTVCIIAHFSKTSVIRAKLDEAESKVQEQAVNPPVKLAIETINRIIQDDNVITRVDPAIKEAVQGVVNSIIH